MSCALLLIFFFFKNTPTPEFYPLPHHAALPIWADRLARARGEAPAMLPVVDQDPTAQSALPTPDSYEFLDRKSTRLNSSHANISYAVFCLKKKKLSQSNIL